MKIDKCNKQDCEFNTIWKENNCSVFKELLTCSLYKIKNGIKIDPYVCDQIPKKKGEQSKLQLL